jgi:hypothetical protein
MAQAPDGIEIDRHLHGVRSFPRRLFRLFTLAAMVVVITLALADVFGEEETVSVVDAAPARLEVSAPEAIRGGLFFQASIRVDARRAIRHATLLLDRGWFEQVSINTVTPGPSEEATRGGRLVLGFGRVAAGTDLLVIFQFQANPAQFFSRRPQGVALADGDVELAHVERTLSFYP